MSNNYIDSIQLSGTVYTIQGTGGGGSPTVELTQAEYDALVSAGTVSANTYYIITDAQEGDLTQYWTSAQTNSAINAAVSGKQDTLISGTNIKTINNESILGSGNIDVHGDWNENSSGSTSYIKNRPFYMEASSSSECALACVPLSDEAWDNNYGCVNTYTIQTTRIFTEGEKLGLSYIYENQYDCEHPQVSPQTIVNNGGVLTVGPYDHWTLTSNDGVNWTVSYSGDFCIQPVIFWKPTIVTYHKLDSNFIDSDIARTSAVTVEISAAVSGKVDTSAITSSVTSASTDSEIPTAKAVWEAASGGGSSITVDPSLDSGSTNPVANSAITNNTLSGGVETSNFFRSVRFRRNNGEVAFYKRFAAINGNSVMVDGTTEAPNFQLVETSAITTSVTSASTDNEIPTAKAVFDAIPTGGTGGGKAISAGTNISVTTGETADTINCTVPYTGDPYYRIAYGYSVNNKSQHSLVIGAYCSTTNSTQNNIVVGYDCHSKDGHNAAFGIGNYSNNRGELSSGYYNVSNSGSTDADKTLFSVGNGTANNARHNAFEIRQNGDIYYFDGTNDVKLQDKFSSLDTTIGNINTILESI